VLIASYLLSASGLGSVVADLQTVLFAFVLLLALRTARSGGRSFKLIAPLVVLGGSAVATAAALTHTPGGEGAADLWKGLLLLLTAALIVRRVLAQPAVTLQSIFGALSAYLIIGLMFAAFYAAFDRLGFVPFFARHQPANTQTFQYFSFTTLTTLGYGDFTAAGDGGRALAVIEALTGQVFLVTLVARLVAGFRRPAEQPGPVQPRAPASARRRWPPSGARYGSRVSYRARRPGGRRAPPPGAG
jgi:hypothetical protein